VKLVFQVVISLGKGVYYLCHLLHWLHVMTRLKVGDLVRQSETPERLAIVVEIPQWHQDYVLITYTDGKSAPNQRARKAKLEVVSASG
jgi:uncharacterized protein (UPF0303 family)